MSKTTISTNNFIPLDPAMLKPGQLVIQIGDKMFPVGMVAVPPGEPAEFAAEE